MSKINLLTLTNYDDCERRIREIKEYQNSLIKDYYSEEWIDNWIQESIFKSKEKYSADNDLIEVVHDFYYANMIASLKNKTDILLECYEEDEMLHSFEDDTEFFSYDNKRFLEEGNAPDEMLSYYPNALTTGFEGVRTYNIEYEWLDYGYGLHYTATETGYIVYMRIYRAMCKHKEEVVNFINKVLKGYE